MLELSRRATLIAATMTTGLFAGLLYAYACSVMPGLSTTDHRTFIDTMQRMNAAILNGWFAISFVGASVFTTVAALLHLRGDGRGVLPWIAAAFLLYAVALIITIGINVPLNNELAAAGTPDRIADLAAVRERFEATWTRWNVIRTVAATAALGCLAWALVLSGRLGAPGGA